MSRGLIVKTMHEVWLMTLIFAVAMAAFRALFAYILPTFLEERLVDQWLELPFVQNILKALMGTEIEGAIGAGAAASIAWAHPIGLALLWAHAIVLCTRVPAGEVDHGTIDVLLGLPVSRARIYLCESLMWLVTGLVVVGMGLVGHFIGARSGSSQDTGPVIAVVVNFFCQYIAVGGMAFLVSSLSDRRGRAVGILFGVVVASLFLSFLAQFWEPAKSLAFLSIMTYYRPLVVLQGGSWPISDMLVLTMVGAVLWLAGGTIFVRRDICTV